VIAVLGSGIIGLSVAIALQERGLEVVIVAAEPPESTTSAVAAAIWHPFFHGADAVYLRRALATYDRMGALEAVAGAGVSRRVLTEYLRHGEDPPWWMTPIHGFERVAECGPYASAYAVAVPLADTSIHLGFLARLFESRGGHVERRLVTSLAEEAAARWVVNCAGFGGAHLAGDTSVQLVRGVVLRCEKPTGFAGCFVDDSDAVRPTYVFEREHDVILGGFAEPGLVSTAIGDGVADDIRRRCETLVPAITGARVLEARVGFRPVRSPVRLERDSELPNVIHDYGHGGAGFTLSWGCADEVAELILASI
jgi:glycine/D-amino acid oxidase-like deaminating enzyme